MHAFYKQNDSIRFGNANLICILNFADNSIYIDSIYDLFVCCYLKPII